MDSQKSPDTIAEWTRFPVSINACQKIFLCFTLKHANDVFLFWILKLFTLNCNVSIWLFFPGFTFHCEQHWYLRKWIVPPSSPLLQNPPASSYNPPSSPSRINSWQFPQIIEIFVLFLSSLIAGSLWNNVLTCCSCNNKHPSVLFCSSTWVVLSCYFCKNYPLYWLFPQPYPLVHGVSLSIL